MRRPIIGVMGGGVVSPEVEAMAYDLGQRIAQQGWVLLNGGRNVGVMDASARGARDAGGLTVGILPGESTRDASPAIDIPIMTDMGSARNNINVLSSDVVVVCQGEAGTLSEIALALKAGKPVIVLGFDAGTSFDAYAERGLLHHAATPDAAIEHIKALLMRS
jgi:uncharacterized protein (TIGR00725 family)